MKEIVRQMVRDHNSYSYFVQMNRLKGEDDTWNMCARFTCRYYLASIMNEFPGVHIFKENEMKEVQFNGCKNTIQYPILKVVFDDDNQGVKDL